MARIETIKIISEKSRTGSRIINASDFDAKTMKKFGAAKKPAKKASKA